MSDLNRMLEQFRQGPAILDAALKDVPESVLDVAPAPGKWTIRQIVRHLADTEIVAGMRLRQMLAEERPTLIPFDQDLWAGNLAYAKADLAGSVRTFRALREDTAKTLDSAAPELFERMGVHPERGDKTLHEWVALFAKHVQKHADQILAIRSRESK